MWIRRGCDSPSSGRTSGNGEGVGEEGEQGRAWLRALRSINNPEAESSSIHVRSADPGVCMKNPEGDGSSIHTGREVGGVFIVSDVFFATKERWVRRRK